MASIARVLTLLATLLVLLSQDLTLADMPSCETVINDVVPCAFYIADKADSPSQSCCDGLKTMVGMAKGSPEMKAICECIKGKLMTIPYDEGRLSALPKKCGVSLPPIDKSLDCDKWLQMAKGIPIN